MHFHSIKTLIAMGGYGFYFWPAFILTFIVLLSLFLYSNWSFKKLVKQLRRDDEDSA